MAAILGIILTILKIIGIVLLSVLGLVLVIVLLILFVPFRYELYGSFKDNKPKLSGKVTYLLRCVRATYLTDLKKSKLTVKVLCFTIIGGKPKKKKTKSEPVKKEPARKKNVGYEVVEDEAVEEEPVITITDEKESIIEVSDEKEPEIEIKEEKPEIDPKEDKRPQEKKPQEKKPQEKKPKEKKSKEKKPQKSKNSRKKNDKDGIIYKVKAYVNLIKENKSVIDFVLKNIGRLLKGILPNSHVINVKLGLDDPAMLGEIMGGIAVFSAFTNIKVNFVPDFDNKVFEGNLKFKGKIKIVSILYYGLKIYFNKKVKKLIKDFKNV